MDFVRRHSKKFGCFRETILRRGFFKETFFSSPPIVSLKNPQLIKGLKIFSLKHPNFLESLLTKSMGEALQFFFKNPQFMNILEKKFP